MKNVDDVRVYFNQRKRTASSITPSIVAGGLSGSIASSGLMPAGVMHGGAFPGGASSPGGANGLHGSAHSGTGAHAAMHGGMHSGVPSLDAPGSMAGSIVAPAAAGLLGGINHHSLAMPQSSSMLPTLVANEVASSLSSHQV